MVIQPAVEVNPVVDPSPTQANRWWSDSRQQGSADAEISGGRNAIQAANGAGIKRFWPVIRAHCQASKPQATQYQSQVDHNRTGRSAVPYL